MRLDITLTQKYGWSRNKAQQHIRSGLVFLDENICERPATEVTDRSNISLKEDRRINWVSRSAEKLEEFLVSLENPLNLTNKTALDVGSSTGGFTQVLLGHSVASVDAVEVGSRQLHSSLRENTRVHSYEETDIRDFAQKWNIYDIIVCDASFIPLIEIVPSILLCANTKTTIILLYKPQFEAPKSELSKSGVPKDTKKVRERMTIFEDFIHKQWCSVQTKKPSTLLGEKWNQEWIYHIKKVL